MAKNKALGNENEIRVERGQLAREYPDELLMPGHSCLCLVHSACQYSPAETRMQATDVILHFLVILFKAVKIIKLILIVYLI